MLKKALVTTAFLAISSTCAFAAPANKSVPATNSDGVMITAQTDAKAQKTKQQISQLFHWLNRISNGQAVTTKAMKHFFSEDIHYSVNAKLLAQDLQQLQVRFTDLAKQYRSVKVVQPVNEMIIAGNTVAVTYHLKLANKSGLRYQDEITALLTLKDGKIDRWEAVIAHV